jgi:hypothetical protein
MRIEVPVTGTHALMYGETSDKVRANWALSFRVRPSRA